MNGFAEDEDILWCDTCEEFTNHHIEYEEDGEYIIYRTTCPGCQEGIAAGLLKKNWEDWEKIFGYDVEMLL